MQRDLILGDFIRCHAAPGERQDSLSYQLSDMLTLFCLRFKGGQGDGTRSPEGIPAPWKDCAWADYAFTQACLHHLPQIKEKLVLSSVLCNACAMSLRPYTDGGGRECKGAKINLILERGDSVLNICEIRYSGEELVIDSEYAGKLRTEMEALRKHDSCGKSFRRTFITQHGVSKDSCCGIADSEVRLDDLFAG